jgi:hypothetical protein
MINAIREAWSWLGLDPVEIVATNAFGNYIVRASDGSYWRLCPEELSFRMVADDDVGYTSLLQNDEFIVDWELQDLLRSAVNKFGSPAADRCFCLKIPGVFGGKYIIDNVGTIARRELVSCSGDLARQIKDAPDGAKLTLSVIRGV